MKQESGSTQWTRQPERDWTGLAPMIRPTLVVALGGTGSSAAKAARKRITALAGQRHHFVAFRAFDTAYQDNQEPHFIDNAEYVYLGGFNAQAVIADIVRGDAFPHWAKWLPSRLNFQQVAFGAGGIRPIGRLCYFYRRDRVESAIQEALTNITDADRALRFHQQTGVRVNLEAGIDIHVVCSVCGGTGSGMFLDMAFDLRHWAEEHTDREVTVTGHLVLPEAFRRKPVVMNALEANAYVALQELDRYMNASSDDAWEVEHVEGRPESSWRAPFDHCYLLSGLQQGGTSDVDTLASVIGETISLLTLTQVGRTVSDGVINMAGQRKSTRDNDGRLCCYSSYGCLGLEIPWELLGESLGPALAKEVRTHLLVSSTRDDAVIKSKVNEFQARMNLDPEAAERLIPQTSFDRTHIGNLIGEYNKNDPTPRHALQRELRKHRNRVQEEIARIKEVQLWQKDDIEAYLEGSIKAALQPTVDSSSQRVGLSSALQYLRASNDLLRHIGVELQGRAKKAQAKAKEQESIRQILEQGHIEDSKTWSDIWDDVDQWDQQLLDETMSRIYAAHAREIHNISDSIDKEITSPWVNIQKRIEALHLDPPRDEDSYYRVHRAQASICPLQFFDGLLETVKDQLVEQVMENLVENIHSWLQSSPRELAGQFKEVCVEVVQEYFAGENRVDCDSLLKRCYKQPPGAYENELNVFLRTAQANWEMNESYAFRNNKIEISAIGVVPGSDMYKTLERHNHHVSPVEEQRDDYVPILRTEHGISLLGLKRLDAYRESLVRSIVHEQRYDFHFFLDRRWITRVEFADVGDDESEALFLFSMAAMLGKVTRQDGGGYVWKDKVEEDAFSLGRYRREAYVAFQDNEPLREKAKELMEKTARESQEWDSRVNQHIECLEKMIQDKAVPQGNPESSAAPRYLSLDIYQIHCEIRALRKALHTEEMGI